MKKFLALVAPKAPAYKIDVGEVQGAKYVTRKYSVLKWNKKSTYYFAPAGEKFTKSSEFSKIFRLRCRGVFRRGTEETASPAPYWCSTEGKERGKIS